MNYSIPGTGSITDLYNITGNASTNTWIRVTTDSGTEAEIHYDESQKKGDAKVERRISPSLYFKYVKSKLKRSELRILKNRLAKLKVLTEDALELRQSALYEEYAKRIAMTVRESEAVACGYHYYAHKDDIERFMSITREDGSKLKPVFFKQLEEFPRSVPKEVKKIISEIKSKKVFDEFWVLYLDYSLEELKTTKQKIKEKDPILFGRFTYDKERFFFITDWTDEFCDLKLSDFIDTLSAKDKGYGLDQVAELDESWLADVKKEVEEREKRLAETNSNNFKELMKKEDELSAAKVKEKSEPKVPWYKRRKK